MELRWLEENGKKSLQFNRFENSADDWHDVPTVQAEKKEWCEHYKKSITVNDESNYFVIGSLAVCVDDPLFKFCPICGTPRPKEG